MKEILNFIEKIFANNLFKSLIVVIVALTVYKVISHILLKKSKKIRVMNSNKGETYLNIVNSTVKYTVIILAVIMLLQVNNVNASSIVASIGIVGVVFSLTVQDALKDVIRGFSIISDNYFKVGDLVEFEGIEGRVLELGLKTTKICALKTGNIVSISNRNIEKIELVSDFVYINVPLPYELKLESAEKIMLEIAEKIQKSNSVKKCSYLGVNELADSAIKYLLCIECGDNKQKFSVKRMALHNILDILESHNISVPYNQIDVHNK